MHLEIISPDNIVGVFENVKSIVFPGKDGSFGVLENHAPMVALLKKGSIRIALNDNSTHTIEISSGIADIKANRIIVIIK